MTRLGPYVLERELARGGMGAVHLALDPHTGAHLALKTLPRELAQDPDLLLRFQAEAQLAAQLDHPHIARVHAADFSADPPYLVQELITGGSLQDRLQHGPLPIDEAVRVVSQLCDAVAHAHQHGVIHRDLKPDNVLFDEHGHAKLVDFGIARQLADDRRLSITGEILGTPNYMAPEQAEGLKATDERTDVYGLGGILYACLTGHPPFAGNSSLDTIRRVLEAHPTPPHKHNPDVPPWLDAVTLRALSKRPIQRFPSAADLAAALTPPLPARRRRPQHLLLAACAVASAIPLALYLTHTPPQPSPTSATDEPTPRDVASDVASALARGDLTGLPDPHTALDLTSSLRGQIALVRDHPGDWPLAQRLLADLAPQLLEFETSRRELLQTAHTNARPLLSLTGSAGETKHGFDSSAEVELLRAAASLSRHDPCSPVLRRRAAHAVLRALTERSLNAFTNQDDFSRLGDLFERLHDLDPPSAVLGRQLLAHLQHHAAGDHDVPHWDDVPRDFDDPHLQRIALALRRRLHLDADAEFVDFDVPAQALLQADLHQFTTLELHIIREWLTKNAQNALGLFPDYLSQHSSDLGRLVTTCLHSWLLKGRVAFAQPLTTHLGDNEFHEPAIPLVLLGHLDPARALLDAAPQDDARHRLTRLVLRAHAYLLEGQSQRALQVLAIADPRDRSRYPQQSLGVDAAHARVSLACGDPLDAWCTLADLDLQDSSFPWDRAPLLLFAPTWRPDADPLPDAAQLVADYLHATDPRRSR